MSERIVKEVNSISHNWFVVEKKYAHKVNYYLLRDCEVPGPNESDFSTELGKVKIKKELNIFNVIAESLEMGEKFSGKIAWFPDIKKNIERTETHAKGKYGVEEVKVTENYIHTIKDVGSVPDVDVKGLFGDEYEGFTLMDQYGHKENLFYNKSLLKKAEPVKQEQPKSEPKSKK